MSQRSWKLVALVACATALIVGADRILSWAGNGSAGTQALGLRHHDSLESSTHLVVGALWAAVDVDTAPEGWLLCDGRALRREEYPELFDVMKSAAEKEQSFRLPDYRGIYVAEKTGTAFNGHFGESGVDGPVPLRELRRKLPLFKESEIEMVEIRWYIRAWSKR